MSSGYVLQGEVMAREEHRKKDGPRLWAKVFVLYSVANEDSPETFKTGEQYNHIFFSGI